MRLAALALAAVLPLAACSSDGTNNGNLLNVGANLLGNDSASRTNNAITLLSSVAKNSGYDFEPEAVQELRTQLADADLPAAMDAYNEDGFTGAARQLVGSMIQNHLIGADAGDKSIAPEAVASAFDELCPLKPFCD